MRPRPSRAVLGLAALLAFLPFAALARGDDPKGTPGKSGAKGKADAYSGPEIAWAHSFADAKEEAAERNVAMYLHSHGST